MRAKDIYSVNNDEIFPWRVYLDEFGGSLITNDVIRDWLKENISPINGTQAWQYAGMSSIKFQKHEDALLCFVRFA